MKDATLRLEERAATGAREARRLRKNGYIPGVVYGKGIEAKPVKVKASEFREFLARHGRHAIFRMDFAGEKDLTALIKDVQFDTMKNNFVHVDFQKISLTEEINVDVPVKIIGREMLERTGGVIVHQLNEITVKCLPEKIPQHIEIDVSLLQIGQSLTAGQLNLPEGVTMVTEPQDVVLSVTAGKTADVEPVKEGDEAPAEAAGQTSAQDE